MSTIGFDEPDGSPCTIGEGFTQPFRSEDCLLRTFICFLTNLGYCYLLPPGGRHTWNSHRGISTAASMWPPQIRINIVTLSALSPPPPDREERSASEWIDDRDWAYRSQGVASVVAVHAVSKYKWHLFKGHICNMMTIRRTLLLGPSLNFTVSLIKDTGCMFVWLWKTMNLGKEWTGHYHQEEGGWHMLACGAHLFTHRNRIQLRMATS